MDSSDSRASRESTSEEDGDCDVFLSDSDSDERAKETDLRNGPRLDGRRGPPLRERSPFIAGAAAFAGRGPSARPEAFIPHPMSASHLKKPRENIYFASASAAHPKLLPAGAGLAGLAAQHVCSKRFASRGLKRRWEEPRQNGTALVERPPHVKTRGDLLFAQKCSELQVFIRPLTVLLNGLKTGRYEKGLSSFQQSVATDRLQRIVGVLQKPSTGERYLGTLLQVEMMLKIWFPHVTTATPSSEGCGPAGTERSTRKAASSSSDASEPWESSSPLSSRGRSFSDGGVRPPLADATGRSPGEARDPQHPAGSPGPAPPPHQGGNTGLCRLASVTQDSLVSSTTYPHFNGLFPQPWRAVVGPPMGAGGGGRERAATGEEQDRPRRQLGQQFRSVFPSLDSPPPWTFGSERLNWETRRERGGGRPAS
ncbi:circadian-associated transcriptional repressor-like isoform X2 [Heptranchias perlo]|uniref:circadian-associated transcriptional repressor-like isoform X2 n=1 Tax=Heptranchias perlo TaxID=212740 RepID=UPI00355940D6